MKKTRFAARIIAAAVTSAVLAVGAFSVPAQADTGWPMKPKSGGGQIELLDTGWPMKPK